MFVRITFLIWLTYDKCKFNYLFNSFWRKKPKWNKVRDTNKQEFKELKENHEKLKKTYENLNKRLKELQELQELQDLILYSAENPKIFARLFELRIVEKYKENIYS